VRSIEAIAGRLRERCPKKGAFGGEGSPLCFQGKRSIEKLSIKVNFAGHITNREKLHASRTHPRKRGWSR
jgi:hypothetical protein